MIIDDNGLFSAIFNTEAVVWGFLILLPLSFILVMGSTRRQKIRLRKKLLLSVGYAFIAMAAQMVALFLPLFLLTVGGLSYPFFDGQAMSALESILDKAVGFGIMLMCMAGVGGTLYVVNQKMIAEPKDRRDFSIVYGFFTGPILYVTLSVYFTVMG